MRIIQILSLVGAGQAFQSTPCSRLAFRPSPCVVDTTTATTTASSGTQLNALGGFGPEQLQDLHSVWTNSPAWSVLADASTAASLTADLLQNAADAVPAASVEGLSKAVEGAAQAASDGGGAAAAAAAAAADDGGLWQSYLQIFKGGLSAIHGAIDQPLRDAGFEQTWGVSIAVFTVACRSLLIPLSVQQSKSAEYLKALKPYQSEIKEKFKDNQELQNQYIGKLYEDANQNPLSGCLFSLLQLPILLGLYRGIRLLAQDGALKEPFLWIPSLEGPVSAPDFRGLEWLTEGWTKVDGVLTPQLGWETTVAFLIMPVLLVLGQSVTMSILTPPIDDTMGDEEREQMEKSQLVLKFLPLMIGFFSLQVPAGLTIYWFMSNIFSLSQSLIVKAYYGANPPKIELPEYWDALDNLEELSAEEKREAAKEGFAVGPKFSDMLEEAKFHLLVERKPLRADSEAWQRVVSSSSGSIDIPAELKAWVGEVKDESTKKDEAATLETATATAAAAAASP